MTLCHQLQQYTAAKSFEATVLEMSIGTTSMACLSLYWRLLVIYAPSLMQAMPCQNNFHQF